MKMPPYLIGGALLFWGWATGHFLLGMLIALVVEGGRRANWHWELTERDYHRIWDLCVVFFVAAFLYFFTTERLVRSGHLFVQWWPLIFLPIMIAQRLGNREKMGYRTFFWLLRRRPPVELTRQSIDVSFLYFAVCVFAASASDQHRNEFYPGFVVLMAGALGAIRPTRFSWGVWMAMLAAVGAAGYLAQRQLPDLQNLVENQIGGVLAGFIRKEPSDSASHTAIGRIGKLKLSGRIVLEVEPEPGAAPPSLLREASFQIFNHANWYAGWRNYSPLSPDPNDVWRLVSDVKSSKAVTISGFLHAGKGLLVLPNRTTQIENLVALEVEHSPMGIVRVVDGPGFVRYRARYGSGPGIDALPSHQEDLAVPEEEVAAMAQIATELKLGGKAPPVVLQDVQRFFQDHFRYTTDLASHLATPRTNAPPALSPLSRFLLVDRAGHCEYFATATVLLLRSVGIPARYATGYAVQESAGIRQYVVRERHAHAWCLVYRDGRWEDYDTTPAGWDALEAKNASFLQPIRDLWSRFWFGVTRWRYERSYLQQYALWLVVPVALFLAARLVFHKRRVARGPVGASQRSKGAYHGHDSEFYVIEQRLARVGLDREAGEPLSRWLARIRPSLADMADSLLPIIQLHYRHRFDPRGLTMREREGLAAAVAGWLRERESRAIGANYFAPSSAAGIAPSDRR